MLGTYLLDYIPHGRQHDLIEASLKVELALAFLLEPLLLLFFSLLVHVGDGLGQHSSLRHYNNGLLFF